MTMKMIFAFVGVISCICFACNKSPQNLEKSSSIPSENDAVLVSPEHKNTIIDDTLKNDSVKNEESKAENTHDIRNNVVLKHTMPKIPSYPDSPDADNNWSNIHIIVHNNSPELPDEERVRKEISPILQAWNKHRNAHDAKKLAKLFNKEVIIRGNNLTRDDFEKKMKDSFVKNSDFKQTPQADVYVDFIYGYMNEPVEYWSVRFNEVFTQAGKTTKTEISLVLSRYMSDDAQSDWHIDVESDVDTDRSLRNKLSLAPFEPDFKNDSCDALKMLILAESPLFRFSIAKNYEAFRNSEESDLRFDSQDGYRLYEDHDDRAVTLDWFEIDVNAHTMSGSSYPNSDVKFDSRFYEIIPQYCSLDSEKY